MMPNRWAVKRRTMIRRMKRLVHECELVSFMEKREESREEQLMRVGRAARATELSSAHVNPTFSDLILDCCNVK